MHLSSLPSRRQLPQLPQHHAAPVPNPPKQLGPAVLVGGQGELHRQQLRQHAVRGLSVPPGDVHVQRQDFPQHDQLDRGGRYHRDLLHVDPRVFAHAADEHLLGGELEDHVRGSAVRGPGAAAVLGHLSGAGVAGVYARGGPVCEVDLPVPVAGDDDQVDAAEERGRRRRERLDEYELQVAQEERLRFCICFLLVFL